MASSGGGAAARMDPDAAAELVRNGATLLLLDVPQHTLVGIDTQVFSVGPKFKGIKMVPPGPHFVYYCSSSRHGNEFAPTVGFFLTTHPSEVIIRKWHVQEERLMRLSEEEEIRYSEAVRRFEFDDQLGPYNLDSFGDWKQLSSYLSQSVIERLEPIGGEITIALESSWMDKAPQTDMERRLMEQLGEDKFAKNTPAQSEWRGCYYTTIPASVKHRNISADELTLLNLDRTSLLESVLAKNYQGQEDLLLGELQFSFVAFMMGQSLEAFMQWKALVSLLLSCSEAPLHTRTNMFVKFIRVIYYQFKHGFQRTHDSRSSDDKGNSLFLDEAWFSRDIFLYRLSKHMIWTANRLERRQLPNHQICPLCSQDQETAGHLFMRCPWTRDLWFTTLHHSSLSGSTPSISDSIQDWWSSCQSLSRSSGTRILTRADAYHLDHLAGTQQQGFPGCLQAPV